MLVKQRILGQKLFESAPRLLSRLRVCSPQQKTTAEHSPKECALKEKLPRVTIALHYMKVLRPAAVLYLTSVSIYGAFQLRLAADIRQEQLRVLRCVAHDADPPWRRPTDWRRPRFDCADFMSANHGQVSRPFL